MARLSDLVSPSPADAAGRPSRSLDPHVLLALRDLELRVRTVMEGVRAGLHRSPFTGSSVEFSEYRAYSPGDDLRRLDWRVLARTDRQYLRKHEEETNLRCWLLLDGSRSMAFGSRPGVTKADYARTLTAALAWFLQEQRDLVGVGRFDQHLHDVIPPRFRPGHLRQVIGVLEREAGGRDTDVAAALREVGRLARRRSLIILISDFLAPVASWRAALGELAAARHEIRAIQVLDPAEIDLEHVARAALWEDLETGQTRYVDPVRARTGYQTRFDAHQREVREALQQHGISPLLTLTTEPIDRALLHFLRTPAARGRTGRPGGRLR